MSNPLDKELSLIDKTPPSSRETWGTRGNAGGRWGKRGCAGRSGGLGRRGWAREEAGDSMDAGDLKINVIFNTVLQKISILEVLEVIFTNSQ